jgi:putative membrane-bound dehydrogenase-like protein
MKPLLIAGCLLVFCRSLPGADKVEAPVPVGLGLGVELVAAEPQVRTPTAVQVDSVGGVWVLENNTHFRPKSYLGPETDRLLVLSDFGGSGQAQRQRVFTDGFRDGMGLLLLGDGDVVVSTRSAVLRLRDTDGDGVADERKSLLVLETVDEYPHNGISGLARDREGSLFVGLGENHGIAWELKGRDGRILRGSDEGGVFRFDVNGGCLERWAIGFWNPFGLAVGAQGELFAVDNDPAAGSLCRLLHVVKGGDYGFRYRYGRTPRHPFVSWFGQIPGMLPPVCLVGEAPTGLVHIRSGRLGRGNQGQLLTATWTDHGIQRLRLVANGVSYSSSPEWVLRGGHDFRPSALAEAPDGSLLIADWADAAYEVHGKGRIWRLRSVGSMEEGVVVQNERGSEASSGERVLYESLMNGSLSIEDGLRGLESVDPFVFRAATECLSNREIGELGALFGLAEKPRVRLGLLLALRRKGGAEGRQYLKRGLEDTDGAVQRAAMQWISEDRIEGGEGILAAVLEGGCSRETFAAYLAAVEMLRIGKPDPRKTADELALMALDEKRSSGLRALSLRMMVPWLPSLGLVELERLAGAPDAGVALEAIRILAGRKDQDAQVVLLRMAESGSLTSELRAELVLGLGNAALEPRTRMMLNRLLEEGDSIVAREAARALGNPIRDEGQATAASFQAAEVFEREGDSSAGRRLFYHPQGPRCFTCHAVEGRGGAVGPDLTDSARMSAERLLESIREPSREIAPAYGTWHLKLKDGSERLGVDLFEDNKSQLTLVDALGQKHKVPFADLTLRESLPISLMPPGLDAELTLRELRDLIAFLRDPR